MQLLAFIGSVYVLISYALISRYGTRQFDYANAVVFMPLTLTSLALNAYHAAILSFFFGLIACWRIFFNG